MADISTFTGFQLSYSAIGYTSASLPDTWNRGTGWSDDAGANSLSGAGGKQPAHTNRLGRFQPCSMRFNTGAGDASPYRYLVGTATPANTGGFVFVGQKSGGSRNAQGALCWLGQLAPTTTVNVGNTAADLLAFSGQSFASPLSTGLRWPCGPTVVQWGFLSGNSIWAKILGLDAVTVSGFGITGRSDATAGIGFFGSDGGGLTDRFFGAIDRFAQFAAGTNVRDNAAAIEASLCSQFGITVPTVGDFHCLGDSIGEGAYQFGSQSWPAYIGNSLATWFVMNDSRAGFKISDVYAALVGGTIPIHRPLGTNKPIAFAIYLGANDLLNATTLAQMKLDIAQLCGYLRATYPTCGITVYTLTPHISSGTPANGSVNASEVIRLAYNAWLLTGALGSGVNIVDLANADASFVPAGTTNNQVRAVCGGTNYIAVDPAFATVANFIHWGEDGVTALAATSAFQSGATTAATMAQTLFAADGGTRSRNYRSRNYR